MKTLTREQAETKRLQAVTFLRRIGQDDAADEFEEMTPEEYAEHKGAELRENPQRRKAIMPRTKTKAELETEVADLNDLVDELQNRLDDIAGIAGDEDEDEEDEDTEEDADEDDDEDDDGPED